MIKTICREKLKFHHIFKSVVLKMIKTIGRPCVFLKHFINRYGISGFGVGKLENKRHMGSLLMSSFRRVLKANWLFRSHIFVVFF